MSLFAAAAIVVMAIVTAVVVAVVVVVVLAAARYMGEMEGGVSWCPWCRRRMWKWAEQRGMYLLGKHK